MPDEMKLYSVHLPATTKGPRRRKVDFGVRGLYRFDADVTDKAVAGYPHHRIRLTPAQAKQLEGDGFTVRELQATEPAAPSAGAALAEAVATERKTARGEKE